MPANVSSRPADLAGRFVASLRLATLCLATLRLATLWLATGAALAATGAGADSKGAVCPIPKPVVPDAAADGWGTEAFAEAAQADLKHWLEPVAEGTQAQGSPMGRFALVPTQGPELITGTVVLQRGGPAQLPRTSGPPAAALRPLQALFKSGEPVHIKVKTVAVTPPGKKTSQTTTTHLVHLDGPAAKGGRREINTTWTATWARGTTNAPGPLLSLRCESWENVRTPNDTAWFSDQTAAVLVNAPEAARQFSAGNAAWRLRLQASLPFFKFGHHGVAVADVNRDGLEDVYVCQPGGLPNRLLLHQPDHTVTQAAAEWGVDLLDSCQCALFADLDNDGDPDLVVATVGPLVIFENTGRSFAARIRLPSVLNAYGLAATDYDADGDIDLYAVRYFPSAGEGGELAVPMPHFDANNGGPNFLIRNNGPAPSGWRQFADATAETGLDAGNRRFSYAAVWDDFNNDGRPDLYVANDFGRNNLFLQAVNPDGAVRFIDATDTAGLSDGAFGMSAASGDVNRDGWQDIHLGAMFSSAGSRITSSARFRPDLPEDIRGRFRRLARGNTLFLNKGSREGSFEDVSLKAGITVGRWSWASLFADIDNDTWPDLLVANGFVTGEIADDL